MYNLNSQRLYQTTLPEKQDTVGQESYSRGLASRPIETMYGMKSKTCSKKHHTLTKQEMNNKTSGKDMWSHFSSFPAATNTGDSAMPTRPLIKPSSTNQIKPSLNQDTNNTATVTSINLSPLLVASAKPPPSNLYTSVPTVSVRQYSEELPSRPGTHLKVATYNKDTRSSTTLSNISSEHNIVRADLSSQNGEILLINREGEVVHEIARTDTDLSLPLDTVIQITDGDDECCTNITQLEDGTIAPPPTARDWKQISPALSFEHQKLAPVVEMELEDQNN